MFLLYADFGPDGAVIQSVNSRRQVGQYVVFSTPSIDSAGIPLRAMFQAHTIARHDLTTDIIKWYKHRTENVAMQRPVTPEEREMLLIQLLASEAW